MKKILVAEDDLNLRTMVRSLLEGEGYEIIEAPDGQVALSAVRREHPDLIILDLRMPVVHGYEVCDQVKQDPEFRHIPILIITAMSEEIDRMRGYYVGADEYIRKPFSFDHLRDRVRALLMQTHTGAS